MCSRPPPQGEGEGRNQARRKIRYSSAQGWCPVVRRLRAVVVRSGVRVGGAPCVGVGPKGLPVTRGAVYGLYSVPVCVFGLGQWALGRWAGAAPFVAGSGVWMGSAAR